MVSGGVRRMKAIMKKKPTLVGVQLSVQDLLERLDGFEICLDDEMYWYLSCNDKVTIKYKGKIIDTKDITVSLESEE